MPAGASSGAGTPLAYKVGAAGPSFGERSLTSELTRSLSAETEAMMSAKDEAERGVNSVSPMIPEHLEPPALTEDTFCFEVAWEVVNKVGGIYTVIKTKTAQTVKELGEQYALIGPYVDATAKLQFEEQECQADEYPFLAATIAAMRERGVGVHYGRWLIDGAPKVVLFDIGTVQDQLGAWRWDLWEKCKIGCPDHDPDAQNAVLFGYLCAWFFGEYAAHSSGKQKVVAHFHEWLSGVGLVMTRMRNVKVATIFTTHATLLGRYLCADPHIDFYNHMAHFDPDKEAADRQIYHRYCIERAASYATHVFTAVSQITADEAEHLLKRRPDVVTPNGLNAYKFAALHEFQTLHATAKSKIEKFVVGHFHGWLDFDLDKTLYMFIAGRYEFRNKGCDLFIEALARLNHKLKETHPDVTVVAFIIMPARTNGFNVGTLAGQAANKRHQDTVHEIKEKVGTKILESINRGQLPDTGDLIDKADMIKLKRCVYSSQIKTLPPIVTHNMVEEAGKPDEVLANLRRCQLFNTRSDRVKVIFHPEFLNPSSPLLPMEYEDFVRGCHLGVFPSYYEPWGYTPAECTVMGVCSVTSNLSGFGCFIEEAVSNPAGSGIHVIDRRFQSPEESVSQLTNYMYNYCKLSRRQRVNLRNRVERLSEILGWSSLTVYYQIARHLAVRKAYKREAKKMTSFVDFKLGTKPMRSPTRRPDRFNPTRNSLSSDQVPPEQLEMNGGDDA